MKTFHYTYLITYTTNKYYIGVRSSNKLPWLDTKYVGSSKNTPNNKIVCKTILETFATRKEAVAHEVFLHAFFNVARAPRFYNLAKQLTTKFSCEGPKQATDKSFLKGKNRTSAQKLGTLSMSKHNTGIKNPAKGRSGIKSNRFKPWYYITNTGEIVYKTDITITDFLKSSHNTPFTKASINYLVTKREHQTIYKGVAKGWTIGFLPIPSQKFLCLPSAKTCAWWYKKPYGLKTEVYGISRPGFCNSKIEPGLTPSVIKNGITHSKPLNKGPFKGWSFGLING